MAHGAIPAAPLIQPETLDSMALSREGTAAKRLAKNGKFMPSGVLLMVSLAAAVLLGYNAWTAGR